MFLNTAMRRVVRLMLVPGAVLSMCLFSPAAEPCSAQPVDLLTTQSESGELAGWKSFHEKPGTKTGDVWKLDDGVLVCKGSPKGYIYTEKNYCDFVLTLEWRWPPGKKAGNGGVLVRMTGEHRVWPKSLEPQLNAGAAGDFWGLDGFPLTGPSERRKTLEHAQFGKLTNLAKTQAAEKPAGEWNAYEVIARGDTVTLRVNGKEVNRATGCAVTPGPICLTAEGDEIHFRNVRLTATAGEAADPWVVYEGSKGPGKGKHVVLVSGDEEYRSEEALPQLGKILAVRHGFRCTVLFGMDPKTGLIDPMNQRNIPGLEALESADLMIIATRFRDLPDDQMQHIVEYVESGRPIIGMRTATHAFNMKTSTTYARYDFRSKEWDGGFGRQILGETWINHHGHHGHESSRGVVAKGMEDHPIVRGCEDIWGPTDVYTVRLPLPGDCRPLVMGQVLDGMKPTDKPAAGEKNSPMMPVAWTKTHKGTQGRTGRVFTTTMGSSMDLESEGLRRLLVNAAYWCVGIEEQIPARANVALVGEYTTLPFGFKGFKKGVKPSDHALYRQ